MATSNHKWMNSEKLSTPFELYALFPSKRLLDRSSMLYSSKEATDLQLSPLSRYSTPRTIPSVQPFNRVFKGCY